MFNTVQPSPRWSEGRAEKYAQYRSSSHRGFGFSTVAFADIREFFDVEGNIKPVHKLTVEQASQLASLEVTRHKAKGNGVVAVFRIRLWDKLHALELLAKHFALLTEVSAVRVSGRLTVAQVGRMSDEELAARLREALAGLERATSDGGT